MAKPPYLRQAVVVETGDPCNCALLQLLHRMLGLCYDVQRFSGLKVKAFSHIHVGAGTQQFERTARALLAERPAERQPSAPEYVLSARKEKSCAV